MAGPTPKTSPQDPLARAWITLITRSSYLPGVVLLIHSLYKHNSIHPLIVQYTPTLPADCVTCLQDLSSVYPPLRTQLVVPISVPKGYNSIASRFDDTLTKLRAFEPLSPSVLLELGLEKAPEAICFLDADILIRKNMDDVFDIPLPGNDWIAAHHACICNIDNDPWAPKEWKKENCAVTPLRHPEALEGIVPNTTAEMERVRLDEEKQQTYRLLNSGVFVCRPTQELWERMEKFRVEDPRVKDFAFPDQNFLDVFFRDRWVSLGWQWNAVKTHRYWHSEVWRDEEIRALHYIVDKPWAKRIGKDGVAGYLGRDGTTHSWWWDEYGDWELRVEKREKGNEVLECVRRYAAKPLGEGLVDIVKPKSQEMEKVEGKVIVEVAPAGKLPT